MGIIVIFVKAIVFLMTPIAALVMSGKGKSYWFCLKEALKQAWDLEVYKSPGSE